MANTNGDACYSASTHGDVWIADSGASTHMGKTDIGMRDYVEINEPIKVGTGKAARATKKGTLPLTQIQRNGDTTDVSLHDYKYSPALSVNLFSLMKALEKGWTITNKGLVLILTRGEQRLVFDRVTRTKDGVLVGAQFVPHYDATEHEKGEVACSEDADTNPTKTQTLNYVSDDENENENNENENENNENDASKTRNGARKTTNNDNQDQTKKKQKTKWKEHIDINKFHKMFGHPGKEAMMRTANSYGIKLTGTFEACEDCCMSNIQQARTGKQAKEPSTTPGERLCIDSSQVAEHTSLGGGKVWSAAVDEATGRMWSRIIKSKDETPYQIMELLQYLVDMGYRPRYIRCDDAGENKKLKKLLKLHHRQAFRTIEFEFTSGNTPQFNGKVERKIAVVTRRVRATLNSAKLTKTLRQRLWGEAVMKCTADENILQSKAHNEPAHKQLFVGAEYKLKHKRVFGEIGYVKYGKEMKGKLEDRGRPMMYLGGALDHSADTF